MALDYGKFTIGDIFDIYACSLTTKELLAILVDNQSVKLANGQTDYYATGKLGVKLNGYSKEKTTTLSGTSGSIDTGLLAIQNGSEIETLTDVKDLKYPIPFTSSGTTYVFTNTFNGTAGSEIGFLYSLNTDGSRKAKYSQAETASATEFSYASETKTITLPTGVTDTNWLVLGYPTISNANKISNKKDSFSEKAEIVAKIRLDEIDTDISHIGILHIPRAKFAGEYEISTGDSAAVHAWSATSLAGYSNDLSNIYIFDESDIA